MAVFRKYKGPNIQYKSSGPLKGSSLPGSTSFTQNTSNDVVPGKEVPFGGPDDYILIFGPLYFRKTAISGTDFDWT